ncbi:ABC transporter substrate-binding protein, partial [Rhizobium johnstonii]|uniref:ABC transporter substrate-binding protein n=1 Tax=Rhizobium johnstonii TaxID=3019933 RepID=UPI003F99DF3C
RAAISEAIDRPSITDKIFAGARIPATDFSAPIINGYSKDIKGNEVLKYNPDDAKKLWDKADAISKWDGTFQIAYNSDGG